MEIGSWGRREGRAARVLDIVIVCGPPKLNPTQNQGGGWRWEREVGSAGVGWRDGEKRHTTVIE